MVVVDAGADVAALPDDRIHAPDEKFYLPNFFRGIDASIDFLGRISRPRTASPTTARANVDDKRRPSP